jgi:L-rhamnose isomerase
LVATGAHPGRARTPDELRCDAEQAFALIPGRHRFNLHAIYGEFGGRKVDRDEIDVSHFADWISWAKTLGLGLDFNPTCFSHPKAGDGFTLSHPKHSVRRFWVAHCQRARELGAAIGRALGLACVTNLWIPDGFKDTPADRRAPRDRLEDSLDQIFKCDHPARNLIDSVEPKLFGIGTESYTTGSHEFYLGYAITRKIYLCVDSGHFHPTESVADKLSSVLRYLPGILLHLSRGVRWDSDHVVTLSDELQSIAYEVLRGDYLSRARIGLDYFDASINRVAAWVIGARAVQKALLIALLEPSAIRQAECNGDLTLRLALQEEARLLPVGPIWDRFCETHAVPGSGRWIDAVKRHERDVQGRR